MKIALCLSGQPRSIEKGFEYHKRNLLDHYDVDTFCHFWANSVEEGEEVTNRLKKTYDPKFMYYTLVSNVLRSHDAVDEKYTRIANSQFPARFVWSMFNSLRKSFNCILQYEGSGQSYDVVVRSRYDFALNQVFRYENVFVNKVHVPDDRQTPEHDFCADMFAFGAYPVMKKYCHVEDNLDMFYHQGVTYIGEDMLAAQLKLHGLVGDNMIYVPMNNPFPPGRYNGNSHSLIRDDMEQWNNLR